MPAAQISITKSVMLIARFTFSSGVSFLRFNVATDIKNRIIKLLRFFYFSQDFWQFF